MSEEKTQYDPKKGARPSISKPVSKGGAVGIWYDEKAKALRIRTNAATIQESAEETYSSLNSAREEQRARTVGKAREIGELPRPKLPFTQVDLVNFVNKAAEENERVVKVAMRSEDSTFESIGLGGGPMSESDKRAAMEDYYSSRDKKWEYWRGIVVGAGGILLAGLVVWLLSLLITTE